jgi:hypothetical protein
MGVVQRAGARPFRGRNTGRKLFCIEEAEDGPELVIRLVTKGEWQVPPNGVYGKLSGCSRLASRSGFLGGTGHHIAAVITRVMRRLYLHQCPNCTAPPLAGFAVSGAWFSSEWLTIRCTRRVARTPRQHAVSSESGREDHDSRMADYSASCRKSAAHSRRGAFSPCAPRRIFEQSPATWQGRSYDQHWEVVGTL